MEMPAHIPASKTRLTESATRHFATFGLAPAAAFFIPNPARHPFQGWRLGRPCALVRAPAINPYWRGDTSLRRQGVHVTKAMMMPAWNGRRSAEHPAERTTPDRAGPSIRLTPSVWPLGLARAFSAPHTPKAIHSPRASTRKGVQPPSDRASTWCSIDLATAQTSDVLAPRQCQGNAEEDRGHPYVGRAEQRRSPNKG